MSNYYLINDVHLSDRAPASCTDTYLDDLFDLLHQISGLAEPSAKIILAGDTFHHKTPSRTSHATVMRLIEWARSSTAPVYAVLGNHDLAFDRIGSVDETQPLGVVLKSGAIELLDGWIDDGANGFVYGVPWLMSYDDANVGDSLAGYRADMHTHRDNPSLIVTHAPLYPPGRELTYENYPTTRYAAAIGNADFHTATVHYGHVHEPHGVYQVDGVTFSNPGALSRGSLHEHNLTRDPAYAIWNSDTGAITHHNVNAKPASEVFRLHEAAEAKTAAVNLSGFLDSIAATRLDVTDSASVLQHVRDTQNDPALVAVIESLLTVST